jgi:hypothetical protein
LKTTVLLPAVVSKLVPVIVTEVAVMARFDVLNVTVGAGAVTVQKTFEAVVLLNSGALMTTGPAATSKKVVPAGWGWVCMLFAGYT